MRFFSITCLLLLSACASPEQRANELAHDINVNYSPVCEKLGYTPGSDKHRDCMVSMYNTDRVRIAPGYYGGWYGGMGVGWPGRLRR